MDHDHDAVPAASNDLREEVERLRLLYTTTLEFNASLDFDEVLKRVFHRVVAAVGAQGGSIWIAEGDQLRCRLVVGKASRTLLDTTEPIASAFRDDPLLGGRSSIVSDATGEHSSEILTRMTTDFVALTAMSAAMVADDVTVGKIEMLNKSTGAGIFDERDRELLEGLATSAALALRNAQLHLAGKQAHDLAIILEISREITSTLNLDRVLQSVVNLAGKALPFDQAAIGIFVKGECVIRAIAGEEKVDPKADRTQRLAAWGQYTARNGEVFYLSDRESPSSDAEAAFARLFGPELEAEGLRSGFYLPLKDEQGVLGVLMFESQTPDFLLPRQRELAEILANQTTVALRNAELYAQVPMVDALGALAAKKRALMAVPRGRLLGYAALGVAALLAVTVIRWPLGVAGEAPVFRAMGFVEVRTMVAGVVERVMVREGMNVPRAAPLATLRDAELSADRAAAEAAASGADQMASAAESRANTAEARMQRVRAVALRQEIALVDEEIAATVIRAPVSGTVLTPRPEDRVGTTLAAGDAIVSLGRTDSLELDFGVEQREIGRVTPDAVVRVRVDALPQRTFEGRVTFIGGASATSSGDVFFPVRAILANPDALLKPGMAAHAKVLTANASTLDRIFRGPIRWLRLTWWRIWT